MLVHPASCNFEPIMDLTDGEQCRVREGGYGWRGRV